MRMKKRFVLTSFYFDMNVRFFLKYILSTKHLRANRGVSLKLQITISDIITNQCTISKFTHPSHWQLLLQKNFLSNVHKSILSVRQRVQTNAVTPRCHKMIVWQLNGVSIYLYKKHNDYKLAQRLQKRFYIKYINVIVYKMYGSKS